MTTVGKQPLLSTQRDGADYNAGVATTASPAYDCFISYSHAADRRLAPALQTGLHRFAKPWYRLHALRVFRDDASLAANPGLWSSIQQALRGSEWFVLMASPSSAGSSWVAKEVAYWCATKSTDRLLIVLTAGDMVWDPVAGDYDWSRTSALPSVLRGRLTEEPRHIDARWATSQTDVSLRNPRFRALVAELAATVHGRPKDELIGEDVRQYRRTRRLFGSLLIGLVALAVAATATAVAAVAQRDRARAERDTATSRMLAAQAVSERPIRLDRSLLLSLAALRVKNTTEARSALLGSLEYLPQIAGFLPADGGPAGAIAVDDERDVVATAHGRDVAIWDGRSWQRLATLGGHRAPVIELAFARNGRSLTSVGTDGEIVRWDVRARSIASKAATGRPGIVRASISSDGSVVAMLDDKGAVTVWDGRQSSTVQTGSEGEGAAGIAVSPDGRTLAYGMDAGIQFFDIRRKRPRGAGIEIEVGDYGQRVSALAFSPDGSMLASGGGGGGIIDLWRTADREYDGSLGEIAGESAPITTLTFAAGGDELISADQEGKIVRWDTTEQVPLGDPLPGQGVVEDLAAGPADGGFLSAAAGGPVVRWDTSRSMRLGRGIAEGASEAVSGVAYRPDSRVLAMAVVDRIEVRDAGSLRPVVDPLTTDVDGLFESIAFDPTGTTMAAGLDDGHILLWDAHTWQPVRPTLDGHSGLVAGLAFDPGGDLMASAGDDGKVLLWDMRTRQARGEPLVHGGQVTGIAFQPGGSLLASGGADGKIRFWDPHTRRPQGAAVTGHQGAVGGIAFSPDGALLASSGTDGQLLLWDVRTRLRRGQPVTQTSDALGAVAFAPDGATLAVTHGRDVMLWDVASGQRLGTALTGVLDAAVSLAFSPDGRFLTWGSLAIQPTSDLAVVWDADLGTWRQKACALANRSLTEAEWNRFAGTAVPHRSLCATAPGR
jgi:WD40 repeat protein